MVAPDGKTFLARRPADGKRLLWPISGGESGKEILGLEPADATVRWSADGQSILTYQGADRKTLLITRVDVTTGKRQVVKEWTPADRAGVTGLGLSGNFGRRDDCVLLQPGGGDLYLVNGLK